MASSNNLFVALHRWATRQDENFCTEGIAFVMSHLLAHDVEQGKDFLSQLIGLDGQFPSQSIPEITTQSTDGGERPDIWIESDEFLAIVEVKSWSGLGDRQLPRYWEMLNRRNDTARKRLILVTLTVVPMNDLIGLPPNALQHVRSRRWHQVADWLRELPNLSAASQFLVDHFVAFLSERRMSFDRISWQYLDGCRALMDFHEMLGKAIETAGLSATRITTSFDSRGFSLQDGAWTGIQMQKPEHLYFRPENAKTDIKGLHGVVTDPWGYLAFSLDLTAEDVHFFALSKDNQVVRLRQFLRASHDQSESHPKSGSSIQQTLHSPPNSESSAT